MNVDVRCLGWGSTPPTSNDVREMLVKYLARVAPKCRRSVQVDVTRIYSSSDITAAHAVVSKVYAHFPAHRRVLLVHPQCPWDSPLGRHYRANFSGGVFEGIVPRTNSRTLTPSERLTADALINLTLVAARNFAGSRRLLAISYLPTHNVYGASYARF